MPQHSMPSSATTSGCPLSRGLFVLALTPILLAGLPLQSSAQVIDSSSSTAPSTTTPNDTTDKDVPYVPTPESVAARMLEVAGVTEDDVVYDLGSGDGRIPITAAKEFGARAVGVEIDSALVAKARAKARAAGVADKVTFVQGDLFNTDLSEATVVTLYLWPEVNIQLRPKLLRELDPGDRIVSHDFRMGEWTPDSTVDAGRGNTGRETVYLWTVPKNVPEDLKNISDETEAK
ncbi:MAG: methyltransferase domain-containing protein [Salinibacter sp.]